MAIQKSLDYRQQELDRALRALRLASNHFLSSHDDSYLLTVQAQLRGLAISGGPGMTPLLLDLSHKMKIPLYLYADPNMVPTRAKSKMAAIIAGKTWTTKAGPNLRQYELRTWLGLPAYFMDSTQDMRSREQIIKHISNNQGGSHYDEKIVTVVDVLSRVTIGSKNKVYDGIQMLLLDMAALVFWVGTRMGYVWDCRQKSINEKTDQRIIDLDNQFSKLQIITHPMIFQLNY